MKLNFFKEELRFRQKILENIRPKKITLIK